MRYLTTPVCLVLSLLFTGLAWAEGEAPSSEDRGSRRAEMRRKLLDEFDVDGDGELSDDERATAREEMRERRGTRGLRGDQRRGSQSKGDRPNRGRSRDDRGPQRDGPVGRRGGPDGPPDPGKIFDKYDADGDGQLSREEFMKLSAEMRNQRPSRVRGPREGDRPDGPPREGRRRFDRERPLQNPDDRPGPPRTEGRRRLNDEDPPAAARGRRGGPEGRRGRGAGRPGGFGAPNPEQVFDRFDENGDNQLSRDEFMKLTDRMREMRGRMGRQGAQRSDTQRGGGRAMRDGRGPGRGGPPGEDGPRRPRRPQRPSLEDGVSTASTDDNSV